MFKNEGGGGGAKAIWKMLKKQTNWYWRASLTSVYIFLYVTKNIKKKKYLCTFVKNVCGQDLCTFPLILLGWIKLFGFSDLFCEVWWNGACVEYIVFRLVAMQPHLFVVVVVMKYLSYCCCVYNTFDLWMMLGACSYCNHHQCNTARALEQLCKLVIVVVLLPVSSWSPFTVGRSRIPHHRALPLWPDPDLTFYSRFATSVRSHLTELRSFASPLVCAIWPEEE